MHRKSIGAIVFTGKYGNFSFKMKITYFSTRSVSNHLIPTKAVM